MWSPVCTTNPRSHSHHAASSYRWNNIWSDFAVTMESSNGILSREKIDQMATWVGSTVSSTFFSSLERFSCINISTTDPDDDDDDDYHDAVTSPPTVAVNSNDVSNLPVWDIWCSLICIAIFLLYIIKALTTNLFLVVWNANVVNSTIHVHLSMRLLLFLFYLFI